MDHEQLVESDLSDLNENVAALLEKQSKMVDLLTEISDDVKTLCDLVDSRSKLHELD